MGGSMGRTDTTEPTVMLSQNQAASIEALAVCLRFSALHHSKGIILRKSAIWAGREESYCIFCSIRLYKQPMNDAQVEEIKRHFGVVAEALRSDIRQVAEGHSGIRHELQEIREEFRDEFKEMRALMRLSFSQLDQRIRTLETDISTLNARMDRLETHRA
jgi:transposase-like protein